MKKELNFSEELHKEKPRRKGHYREKKRKEKKQ